jgi:hypothetical protein
MLHFDHATSFKHALASFVTQQQSRQWSPSSRIITTIMLRHVNQFVALVPVCCHYCIRVCLVGTSSDSILHLRHLPIKNARMVSFGLHCTRFLRVFIWFYNFPMVLEYSNDTKGHKQPRSALIVLIYPPNGVNWVCLSCCLGVSLFKFKLGWHLCRSAHPKSIFHHSRPFFWPHQSNSTGLNVDFSAEFEDFNR